MSCAEKGAMRVFLFCFQGQIAFVAVWYGQCALYVGFLFGPELVSDWFLIGL